MRKIFNNAKVFCATISLFFSLQYAKAANASDVQFSPEKQSFIELEMNAVALPNWIKVGDADTFLKINTQNSDELERGTEKCGLYENSLVYLSKAPEFVSNHWKVSLAEPISGCSFTEGFVFSAHANTSNGGNGGNSGNSPGSNRGSLGAFLSVLGFAEGTGNNYNMRFGGFKFNSYAKHPALIYCAGRLCSDAAGRYQFLTTTWYPLARKLGLPDFSPQSQDKAAIQLLKEVGAYTWIASSTSYQNFSNAIYESNTTWASLPGSPYGQPTKSMSALWEHFKSKL